ncbi:MAG: hypothetical protein U1E53_18980 [Dongiaceae bacterium]
MSTSGRVLAGIAIGVAGLVLAHHGHAFGRTVALFAFFAAAAAIRRGFGVHATAGEDGASAQCDGDSGCGGDGGCCGDGCSG